MTRDMIDLSTVYKHKLIEEDLQVANSTLFTTYNYVILSRCIRFGIIFYTSMAKYT